MYPIKKSSENLKQEKIVKTARERKEKKKYISLSEAVARLTPNYEPETMETR